MVGLGCAVTMWLSVYRRPGAAWRRCGFDFRARRHLLRVSPISLPLSCQSTVSYPMKAKSPKNILKKEGGPSWEPNGSICVCKSECANGTKCIYIPLESHNRPIWFRVKLTLILQYKLGPRDGHAMWGSIECMSNGGPARAIQIFPYAYLLKWGYTG